jgi:propanol-preferring alcohol dehydrogenase
VDGGYAEFMKAREEFIYPLPKELSAVEIAPLLCAGIIGYRSLKLSNVPKNGRLGLYGFGASAHVVIQVARHWGCEVYVMTRAEKHRKLALELGAAWAGEADAVSPKKLDSAILFAPAGEIVPRALESLDKGGTLALAGIYMSDVPALDYQKHLFQEKIIRSVTANTREDGRELLELARQIPIKTQTEVFPLEQANEALLKLESDGIRGAGVLSISN